ncbi:MAG: 2-C-methyl-D-erythritol 4-phosphate cytidylyltransferase [Actinomycetota bacterium]|nr:2-C-methyl-D-erythritol 4-phosphate cytidylyltransferase [Actinomycetota bacterium]
MPCGVVVAAGAGERLGAGIFKLEVEILGNPLVFYSLKALDECRFISSIILVVPGERVSFWTTQRIREMGIGKIERVVEGGHTRQESVRNGIQSIEGADVVVIHDGARPCVTPSMIDGVIDIPDGADGVLLAVGVTDTIKEVESGRVKSTLERETLFQAQTPQAFHLDILKDAHEHALKNGFSGTDDASLVERIGGVVLVREGSRENIKVTYSEDLKLAEDILSRRGF